MTNLKLFFFQDYWGEIVVNTTVITSKILKYIRKIMYNKMNTVEKNTINPSGIVFMDTVLI